MTFDKKYLVWALSYAVAGMALGIIMAASHNHGQRVTHAHLLLVGFVVSLIYAVVHKLWLGAPPAGVAKLQIILHQAGAVCMIGGLLLLYGGVMPEARLEPVLSAASMSVFVAAALMLYMVIKSKAIQA